MAPRTASSSSMQSLRTRPVTLSSLTLPHTSLRCYHHKTFHAPPHAELVDPAPPQPPTPPFFSHKTSCSNRNNNFLAELVDPAPLLVRGLCGHAARPARVQPMWVWPLLPAACDTLGLILSASRIWVVCAQLRYAPASPVLPPSTKACPPLPRAPIVHTAFYTFCKYFLTWSCAQALVMMVQNHYQRKRMWVPPMWHVAKGHREDACALLGHHRVTRSTAA